MMRQQAREPPPWPAYAWSLALVVGSTGIALLGRNAFHLPDVVMLYLLAILIASFRFGRGPSIAAAALSVATYDFFFVPPFYTFSVEHARHVMTFAMMFGLGLVVSNLAARLRQEEQQARVREEHTAALYALSRELVGVPDAGQAAVIAAQHAAAVFGETAAVLLRDRAGKLSLPGAGDPAARLEPGGPGRGAVGQRERPPRGGRDGDLPGRRRRLHPAHRRPGRRSACSCSSGRPPGSWTPSTATSSRCSRGRSPSRSSGCASPRRRRPPRCARAARRCAARCSARSRTTCAARSPPSPARGRRCATTRGGSGRSSARSSSTRSAPRPSAWSG